MLVVRHKRIAVVMINFLMMRKRLMNIRCDDYKTARRCSER
jgi:hypothetical protein